MTAHPVIKPLADPEHAMFAIPDFFYVGLAAFGICGVAQLVTLGVVLLGLFYLAGVIVRAKNKHASVMMRARLQSAWNGQPRKAVLHPWSRIAPGSNRSRTHGYSFFPETLIT